MARLPNPFESSERNTWGSILNAYLRVEHNADGTHSFGVGNLATPGVVYIGAGTIGPEVDATNFFYTKATGILNVGSITVVTPFGVVSGGTGIASYTIGDLLYASAATTLSKLADAVDGNVLRSGGVGIAPLYGKVRLSGATTDITGTLAVGNGGVGITAYTIGDILYASGAATLAALADIATGNALISGGIGAAPSWGKIGLTTHVSGTLAVGSGGTNMTTYTIGDLLYASGAGTLAALAAAADGNVLRSAGAGVAPLWGKVRISGATIDITGTLGASIGGTGIDSSGSTGVPKVNAGTWSIQALTNGQLLIGSTGAVPVAASLTAGTGITVTPGAGTITIAATAGSSLPNIPLDPKAAMFPTTNFPQLNKNVGTNWVDYTLDYDYHTAETAYWEVPIASGLTFSRAQVEVYSRQAASVLGNVAWKILTLTRADGEAWDTAGVLNRFYGDAVKGVAGQILRQATDLTTTGWASNELLLISIARDVAEGHTEEDVKFIGATLRLVT